MVKITDKEFKVLQEVMYESTGVRLTDAKKDLAFFRLRKRFQELKIDQVTEYIQLIRESDGRELEIFINTITTNETFFYRHPEQFDYLVDVILPDLLKKKQASGVKSFRIWSAACSTGEEPYTIAIACKLFFQCHPGYDCTIYASDINSKVLDFSKKALYPKRNVEKVPLKLKELFFSQEHIGRTQKYLYYQLHPEIINSVKFLKHNLLKPFPFQDFDIIFLRNVMIYFDIESKKKTVDLLEGKLNRGGYVFISLTENLSNISKNLNRISNGVYQKPE